MVRVMVRLEWVGVAFSTLSTILYVPLFSCVHSQHECSIYSRPEHVIYTHTHVADTWLFVNAHIPARRDRRRRRASRGARRPSALWGCSSGQCKLQRAASRDALAIDDARQAGVRREHPARQGTPKDTNGRAYAPGDETAAAPDASSCRRAVLSEVHTA